MHMICLLCLPVYCKAIKMQKQDQDGGHLGIQDDCHPLLHVYSSIDYII